MYLSRSKFGGIIFVLKSLLLALCLQGEGRAHPGFTEVGPDGIGRLQGEVTYEEIRRIFPRIVVRVGSALPNAIWLDAEPTGNKTFAVYLAFSQDGTELFRAWCKYCEGDGGEEWVRHYIEKRPVVAKLRLVAVNPLFQTSTGISVGSSVRELKKAYPNAGTLYVIRASSQDDSGVSEYACFMSDAHQGAKEGTIEFITFGLAPRKSGRLSGRYDKDLEMSKLIKLDSRISAIQPGMPCGTEFH